MRTAAILLTTLPIPSAFASDAPAIVSGSDVISMILSTLLVVSVILGVGWLYSRSRVAVTGNRDLIKIVSSKALGTKERLLLVEVADQQLLVGMTATQVQTLHVFDAPIQAVEDVAAPDSFASRLKSSLREARVR